MNDARHDTPQDHWIDTGGARMFARTWWPPTPHGKRTDAAPIVLFHDSLGSVELWRNFPSALTEATGRPVVAYDRSGFGQSDPRTDRLEITFVKHEAEHAIPALCKHLNIERFIAMGHSIGGAMAIECAALHTDRCVALVTESAQTFVEDRTLAGIADARELFRDASQFGRLVRYHGDKAQWVLDAWVKTWHSPAFAHWSIDAVLPRVQCPTLAIHGRLDEYGSLAHPEAIAARVSGPSRAVILDDAHHIPHREQEAHVVALIAEFLRPL